ncbi:MAG: T9SS type A sorting domain-containing protein [Burkholderiales bacterium]|nr:T9SS type A sorting domain-containing protein [Bacteroidia bacterium]
MFLKCLVICCVFSVKTLFAFTVKTIANGNWEDPNAWSNHQVPASPDSILVSHYMVLNQNLTINSPTVLFIDSTGTICGEHLLETLCGASFINFGHLYLGQIKTRAGTNYHYIACKNYIIISGCFSGGGYYNNIPPNGSTYVWPAVLCKTQDTNWENGTQIGLIELKNDNLIMYPNPIHREEPLIVISLNNTTIRLMDALGILIETKTFENKTEIFFDKLSAGIYFLEIEIGGKKCIRKIIKTN